jgi:ribosomal protein S18 acetylase RimI-like enzyme
MAGYDLQPLVPDNREKIKRFIAAHWGADFVVARGRIHHPEELPGFIVREDKQIIGLITYQIEAAGCEIVTLDSTRPNQGIGTALIEAVKQAARQAGCTRLWLITTNDNLTALRFYQKRGFGLAALHRNAIELSRQLKPGIPAVGESGIPIRDELELELELD